MKTLFLFLVISLASCSSAPANRSVPWEAVCKQVKSIPIPKADQPGKDEEKSLTQCDSESLYYGIRQTTDYKRARHCAYVEKQKGDDKVFGGSAILMMIYGNGHGVPKNVSLAKQFACSASGAPAEIEARIEHLDKMKETDEIAPIDFCDDITSGYMMGYCAHHWELLADVDQEKQLKEIFDQWSVKEQVAFKKLKTASERFTEARTQNEVDQSGTARDAFMAQERGLQEKDFFQSLQKLEVKKAPKYSSTQYKAEDKKLNSLYQAIQKKEGETYWGTVTREGIKITQRAWLGYRDAWVEFAKLKYPTYSPDSIAAWFTKKRNHMLRSFD